MMLIALMDSCDLLAVDPKTLRHWLKQASMSVSLHPADGRRKCLTREQVQQLAILHDRVLKPDETLRTTDLVEPFPHEALQESTPPDTSSMVGLEKTGGELDVPSLHWKLSHLEALVVNQQQQLILLTQELLRERATRMKQSLSPLEISAHLQEERGVVDVHAENPTTCTTVLQNGVRPLHPAEQRARFLVLPPLIEYSATGTYVVISSQEGEIPLVPDTLEWFEWFRTLSSFRFVGKEGCFGACRGYNRRPTRMWHAHRTIHQHQYGRYLGLSEHLTIAHLEAMAATLQAYV
jgi:hypothetical protein